METKLKTFLWGTYATIYDADNSVVYSFIVPYFDQDNLFNTSKPHLFQTLGQNKVVVLLIVFFAGREE